MSHPSGVRHILDNAAHRGAASLQCADRDPIHAAQWAAAAAAACALWWLARRLSR